MYVYNVGGVDAEIWGSAPKLFYFLRVKETNIYQISYHSPILIWVCLQVSLVVLIHKSIHPEAYEVQDSHLPRGVGAQVADCVKC